MNIYPLAIADYSLNDLLRNQPTDSQRCEKLSMDAFHMASTQSDETSQDIVRSYANRIIALRTRQSLHDGWQFSVNAYGRDPAYSA